jgi:hypothetical protein
MRSIPESGGIAMLSLSRLRLITWTAACAFCAAGASAQTAASHPYGLDPYKPSDAAWLREFGAALVAQTPAAALAALDPYRPSHAALLRQVGGGMPLWGPYWFWTGPGMPMSISAGVAGLPAGLTLAAADVRDVDLMPTTRLVDSPTAAAASPAPTGTATLARPQTNDGISVQFGGRIWTTAGRAVPRARLTVVQAGELAGTPVFKRTDLTDDVIYLQMRDGFLTPFRAKP